MNKAGLVLGGTYLFALVVAVALAVVTGGVDAAMWVVIPLTATNIPLILLENTPLDGLLLFVLGGTLQWYLAGCLWSFLAGRWKAH